MLKTLRNTDFSHPWVIVSFKLIFLKQAELSPTTVLVQPPILMKRLFPSGFLFHPLPLVRVGSKRTQRTNKMNRFVYLQSAFTLLLTELA